MITKASSNIENTIEMVDTNSSKSTNSNKSGTSVKFNGNGPLSSSPYRRASIQSPYRRASIQKKKTVSIFDEDEIRRKLTTLDNTAVLSALANDNCFGCRNCCYILVNSKRALLQLLLAFLFIAGWVSLGVLQVKKAYDSENADYHPQKILKQKTYFQSNKIQYDNPYFYFWFRIDITPEALKNTFDCSDNSTANCLKEYFDEMLTWGDNIDYSSNDYSENDDVLHPWCQIETFNATTGESSTAYGKLKDYKIYVNRLGSQIEVGSDYGDDYFDYSSAKRGDTVSPFAVLIQLEISNIDPAKGRYSCDNSLNILSVYNSLGLFTDWFDLWMFMSRVNITHAVGIDDDAPWMRSIFSSEDPVFDADMRFFYEERVLCNLKGLCSSEFYVESSAMVKDLGNIKIILNPLPKVTYYKEFVQYTWLDCASSIGGFWTIILGIYIVASTCVVKFKRKKDKGQFKMLGILPMLSKTHENEEEIAYLRKIVMTLLNLHTEHCFHSVKNVDAKEGLDQDSSDWLNRSQTNISPEGEFDTVLAVIADAGPNTVIAGAGSNTVMEV